MRLWKSKNNADVGGYTLAVPQTAKSAHPYTRLSNTFFPSGTQFDIYSSLREAVPIIDAAIHKLVRLTGGFSVECSDRTLNGKLRAFTEGVSVSGTGTGLEAFISAYFEQLLTYGTAVGEMIVRGGELTHLYNTDLKAVRLDNSASPLNIDVLADNGKGEFLPVRYPSLILVSSLNPECGSAYGTSLLRGLPFMSDILMKIYNTIGTNWDRLGNLRFAVTYRPQPNDMMDAAYAKQRAEQIASEWSRAMQPGSAVKDFVSVGDVNISVIGADNQILDSSVPVRELLEQIIAKLGVPPFMFGLSWSTTERMSYQQADLLTSEIEAYRRLLTPVITKICNTWLRLNSSGASVRVLWDEITLQDMTEIAQSELYEAQAKQIYHTIGGETDE